ncbi:MAG TPA: hypothetical protein VFZ21_21785, partial [Gemmatimonadaceae bacterium]|nr:hypothetical protein [Gemmatimonadaceae bacterium]
MTSRIRAGHRAAIGPTLRRLAVSVAALAALAALGGLVACNLDKVLSVDAPSRVLPGDLENPANARVIINGVVADFECAFGSYTLVGGTVGEELHDASVQSQWWVIDRRSFGPSGSIYSTGTCARTSGGVYGPLSTARWQADNAIRLLESWSDAQVPGRTDLLAKAYAYAGYSYLLLGEAMCSAAVDAGPELSRDQLFALAEDRFTSAIADATTSKSDSIRHLALVGRARARLDRGHGSEAAADARLVPAGFQWNATFTANDPLRENQVFVANRRSLTMTVDEPYRSLSFAGQPDPRVATTLETGRKGPDQETVLYYQNKYLTAGAPIPLARYAEAQLIIAEVDGGQAAVDIINALHDKAGLPHFTSTDP